MNETAWVKVINDLRVNKDEKKLSVSVQIAEVCWPLSLRFR